MLIIDMPVDEVVAAVPNPSVGAAELKPKPETEIQIAIQPRKAQIHSLTF